MPIYRVEGGRLQALPETTFAAENFRERQDLQQLFRRDITLLGADLKLLREEFSGWQDSERRIDLLCIDREARLVVVELKRTTDGGHMELQAIRYAAMVSVMTFADVLRAHAVNFPGAGSEDSARVDLLSFLGWDVEKELNSGIRIVLVAADFSVEITTAVLWLNKNGLDLTCFRARPHRLNDELLIDLQQIIPLPEAAVYEVKARAQEREKSLARLGNEAEWSGNWYVNVGENEARSWEDMRRYGFVAAGGGSRWIKPLQRLSAGDSVFAYQSGRGYVGSGRVVATAVPVREFAVRGTLLSTLPLGQPGILHDVDDLEITEWLVAVEWVKTFEMADAKTFKGVFANQGSVCRLTHLQTLEFLRGAFLAE